jgi:arylsulfatase A-like enzyme
LDRLRLRRAVAVFPGILVMKVFLRFLLCFVCLTRSTPAAQADARKPNIIFILADDLGYGDVGVFYQNSRAASQPRMATPNLDRMAAEGMLWRNHYTGAPVCAPARASLLLGRTQGHCAIRDNQFDKALPDNHTLATVLKHAGYRTACIGKWGLQGQAPEYPGHPLRHGFDEFFGFLEHVSGHTYYHDETKPLREGFDDVTGKYRDIYSTDLFTARAKKFIADHEAAHAAQPFFLYLAYTAVHNPLHVPGGPYPAGAGRDGGLQWPLAPTPETRDTWIHPDYAGAAWTDAMKRYATMVRRLDDGVGDVLQLLRDMGLDQNTLVIFSSDNGPANENGSDPRLFDSWGPFDGFKRDCWEGGLREPTIAWRPGSVKAGAVSDVISGHWDWMPTFAEIAGLAAPAQCDGVSLVPSLTGEGVQRSRGYMYGEYFVKGKNPASDDVFKRKGVTGRGQQQLLRIGDMVAIRTQITDAADPVRLYNVRTDPHEDHDLATDPAHAALVARMQAMLITARRPEPSAPRPYDNQLLPAVALAEARDGALDFAAYEGNWPWVPDFDALKPLRKGRAAGLDLSVRTREEQIGMKFSGFLKAPADGGYTFYLGSDSGAHLWLHDAHVIDDDFNHDGAVVSASILLKAGLHPIRVFYRHASGPPKLELEYDGPGIPRQPVPASAFCAADGAPVLVTGAPANP